MSVTSGFFNSLNGDRKYNAEQMSSIFDGIINDGVFQSIGTAFSVKAVEGNNIQVGIGRAWFNSAWVFNDSILPITLEDAELVVNRIDAVVIEINHNTDVRSGSIKVVKGTPASEAQRPELTKNEYVNQYPLAYIYRKADSTVVNQADITSMIGTEECPYVNGILEVQTIDNIVAQWGDQWVQWFKERTAESDAEADQAEKEWAQWFADTVSKNEADASKWMTELKADFESWFNEIKLVLEPETAQKLAEGIANLNLRLETLMKERFLYDNVLDSSGEPVQDSNGLNVEGRVRFGSSNDQKQNVLIVYPKQNEDPYKVGDILTTARTDLGDKWLLCNGEAISRTKYPKLSELYPITLENSLEPKDNMSGGGAGISISKNGVVFSRKDSLYISSSDPKYWNRQVLVRERSGRGVTTSEVATVYATEGKFSKCVFMNNQYVFPCTESTTKTNLNTRRLVLYNATAINATISSKITILNNIQDSNQQTYPTDASYLNGKYVILINEGDSLSSINYASIVYADSFSSTASNWTKKQIWSSNSTYTNPKSLIFENGYYSFIGVVFSSGYKLRFAYSNELGTGWKFKNLYSVTPGPSSFEGYSPSLKYINGKYLIISHYEQNNRVSLRLSICDSVEGDWGHIDIYEYDGTAGGYSSGITYGGGYYAAIGLYRDEKETAYVRLSYSTDLYSGWKFLDLPSEYGNTPIDIVYWNGLFYGLTNNKTFIFDIKSINVPEISLSDKTYTYIKALE